MKISKLLTGYQKIIHDFFSSIEIPEEYYLNLTEKNIKEYLSSDKGLGEELYVPNFNYVEIKSQPTNTFLSDLITDKRLKKLFASEEIYAIHYFKVWGSVVEHTDSKGLIMGYPCDDYNTFVMPLQVPSEDPEVFSTYYNGQYKKLQEGVFENWDVTNVKHSWTFDYDRCNKCFLWLRIDLIEGGLDRPFDSVYNSSVRRSDSISFF